MAFAHINGIRLPVLEFDEADDSLISDTRLTTGGMHRNLTGGGRKRAWTVTTTLMELYEAHAWRALLEGHGFRWGFGPLDAIYYSDKALLLTSSGAAASGSGGPFGGEFISISSPATAALEEWDEWTVVMWSRPGGSWIHRAQTSEGTQYQDGEAWTYSWSAVADSGLTISADHGAIAEVVALPAVMPSRWIDELAQSSRRMARYPLVRLSGDCLHGQYADVLATDVRLRHAHTGDGRRWAVVSFVLREA